MKNITLLTILFISSLGMAQVKTPFLNNLGARTNQDIECFCTDTKGQVTIGYFSPINSEILIFDKWDPALKKWILINKMASLKLKARNFIKCIYTNSDSLLVFSAYKDAGAIRYGLFHISPVKTSKLSDFRSSKGRNIFMADLKIIKNKLITFGNYDTIINWTGKHYDFSNISIYTGTEWISSDISLQLKQTTIKNTAVANNADTTTIVFDTPGYDYIVRYYYPNKWETIRKIASKKPAISSITFLGKRWLLTRTNSDTIILFNGESFIEKQTNLVLNSQINIINSSKGILVNEDSKTSKIYRLDTSSGKFQLFYQGLNPNDGDTVISSLLATKQNVFYRSNIPIYFKDKSLGKIAEINVDSGRTIKYNTIEAYVFYDKNNNFKLDNGEDLVPATLKNRTYRTSLTSATGIFIDKIPDFNDVEYELINYNFSECVKLPFSGAIKTNTLNGVNDPLYFPLQKTKAYKNLSVQGFGKATARMLDTIALSIKLTNNNCDQQSADAQAVVVLDSNTTFIESVPAFASKIGNSLFYDLKTIGIVFGYTIQLKVQYSNTSYKLNDYVKHKVFITAAQADDSSDNTDSIVQKLTYSYDPNAKYSIPQGTITANLKSIRYYIEFQNEGNDYARRVIVVDSLDTRIPVYEFQMVGCSHPYSVSIKNNVVTWVFDNINLPFKSMDDKQSQGYIVFDAQIISNMMVGDSIRNKAYIYFDFNEPIVTNLAIIKRIEDLPKIDETDFTFRFFPNPAAETVTIENKINVFQEIKVINILGQEVVNLNLDPVGKTLQSISTWPRGMYFIRSTKGHYQKFLVH